MTKTTPVISLSHLTKRYGKARGITDISLDIHQGEVFGFLGPNGAGKSTTINVILDLLRPNTGSVKLFDQEVREKGKMLRKRIGYLSGDMTTDSSLTGRQYLEFTARHHDNISRKRVNELVKRLRCETDKRIKHLSRGNRQKIGLVAALMHDPDLLILDEPTSGLDPLVQEEFNALIREHKASGKTTFMSSHVLSEVQATCDRVGFIRDGKLIRVSPLEKLMEEAPRLIRLQLRKSGLFDNFKKLSGVSDLHHSGRQVTFTYRGDYDSLIRALSRYSLLDIQITEPPLDDLFMKYYQTAKGKGTQ